MEADEISPDSPEDPELRRQLADQQMIHGMLRELRTTPFERERRVQRIIAGVWANTEHHGGERLPQWGWMSMAVAAALAVGVMVIPRDPPAIDLLHTAAAQLTNSAGEDFDVIVDPFDGAEERHHHLRSAGTLCALSLNRDDTGGDGDAILLDRNVVTFQGQRSVSWRDHSGLRAEFAGLEIGVRHPMHLVPSQTLAVCFAALASDEVEHEVIDDPTDPTERIIVLHHLHGMRIADTAVERISIHLPKDSTRPIHEVDVEFVDVIPGDPYRIRMIRKG